MRVLIDVFGDKQVARDLLRFGDRARDASPAFRAIADLIAESERDQFQTGGRHASAGWDPLAPATIARKLRGPNPENAHTVLVDTGALRASLIDENEAADIGRQELTYSTDVPYARFHQLGEGVPRRRPLELRAQDRDAIVRILQRHLIGEQRGAL